jgi:hypothetical protein
VLAHCFEFPEQQARSAGADRSGSATGNGGGAVAGQLDRARQARKNYVVELEMLCPAGAYRWAPEIPQ